MFERYNEKARRVIFFARYEASQYGSPYIESEHMLLGILREDKVLTSRIRTHHAAVESIRQQVQENAQSREKLSTSVDLPLSNECKRILAAAARESERLEHKFIGTEHLLLGIFLEKDCKATKMLKEEGIQEDQVRKIVESGVGHMPPKPVAPESLPIVVHVKEKAAEEPLLVYRELSLRPMPRIGDTIAIHTPGASERRFRVTDVVWNFLPAVAAAPLREVTITVEASPSQLSTLNS